MDPRWLCLLAGTLCAPLPADESVETLRAAIAQDYETLLGPLFDHFHRNPELSLVERKTAARLAHELRAAGFEVTEGVGGTGLVALLKNGDGPLVMMRADMDGLPVEEKSGLPNASQAVQTSPITGMLVPVMHACGHDVHMTALVGTARRMAALRDHWSGTVMLIGQPAEERGIGAKAMREDRLWERFGKPDYALAFHVTSLFEAGKLAVTEGAPYAGVDSVDMIIHRRRSSRSLAASQQGPDRAGRTDRPGASNPRRPRASLPATPAW